MEHQQIDDVFTDKEHSESSQKCNISIATSNCSQSVRIALYDVTPEAIIVPCVFTIILLVGVIGNTLLILSFARHKSLSTPHNALVVNLASGDFIFLIVSLPFNMVWYTLPSWRFGLVICKLSHFADNLSTTVVISTLSVLSVERCLIVTGKKLWRQQKQGHIWLTLTIWVISLIVSLPSAISANLVNKIVNNETQTFCFPYDASWGNNYSKAHIACMFIFLFCLPLLIITTAYILIAVHLLLRAFPLSQSSVAAQKPKGRSQYRCCVWKNTTKNEISGELRQIGISNIENNAECRPKDVTCSKLDQENACLLQQPPNSKFSPAKEDKSCSPDSCTETTELQPTPVLPYSFVYTGPIPVDAVQKQEAKYSKMNAITTSMKERKESNEVNPIDPPACSTTSWKETTPLNPSNISDVKAGYRQRQQSLVTKRRRLALTVLMLIIAFAVCWTPRHVYLLWYHFLPDDFNVFWHVFKIIGFCLSSSNSAVNPVVFYILDNTYRSFVHRAICTICMKACRPKTSNSGEAAITIGERDYNATIAMTDMKSKANMTEL